MRVILAALNARFSHSSLALRYLRCCCRQVKGAEVELREYSINDTVDFIVGDLFRAHGEVVAFSCYIWNITPTLQICHKLKQAAPETLLILGGPEVSYDAAQLLAEYPYIDAAVMGEGEETFSELLAVLVSGRDGGGEEEERKHGQRKHERQGLGEESRRQGLGEESRRQGIGGASRRWGEERRGWESIPGLVYRSSSWSPAIKMNPPRPLIKNLDSIPSPYQGYEKGVPEWQELKGRTVYFESSRGCFNQCQYCLSSIQPGVRFFSLDRVKADLRSIFESGADQVKFVDRTFNCTPRRAREIWGFLEQNAPEGMRFHFEIAADLLDAESLDFLEKVRPGLFEFEIGVQSTCEEALQAVKRRTDWERLRAAVIRLRRSNNIRLHLDLIAGLPGETYDRFQQSFNDVYALRPHYLQLGFLKLLKGSGIRERAEEYGYVYSSYPPYEVLGNKWISFAELLRLHLIEDLLEKYYNSRRFQYSLEFLLRWKEGVSPFSFYEAMAGFWEERGYQRRMHGMEALFFILQEFAGRWLGGDEQGLKAFHELLKLDCLLQSAGFALPPWFQRLRPEGHRQRVHDFWREPENVAFYIPELLGFSVRDINKYTHVELFAADVAELARLLSPEAFLPELPGREMLRQVVFRGEITPVVLGPGKKFQKLPRGYFHEET